MPRKLGFNLIIRMWQPFHGQLANIGQFILLVHPYKQVHFTVTHLWNNHLQHSYFKCLNRLCANCKKGENYLHASSRKPKEPYAMVNTMQVVCELLTAVLSCVWFAVYSIVAWCELFVQYSTLFGLATLFFECCHGVLSGILQLISIPTI